MKDLIDECGKDLSAYGYETVPLEKFNATSNKLFIETKEQAQTLGFEKGHYFIINAPLLPLMMQEHKEMLEKEVASRLKFLMKQNKLSKNGKTLFVGIGNPALTADSFGVKAVEKIPLLAFKKNNRRLKLLPNVFSNTGFNAFEIVRLVVEAYDISAVVMFDSLATENISRLGTSLQFNDAGLTPGSAMNNFGSAMNRHTLNVPCIAIGVPMMISSKSLGQKRDIILTDNNVGAQVEFLSLLLAEVIDRLF